MKNKTLVLRLYIPLIVLAIVVTIAAWLYVGRLDIGNLLLNFSTEVLGIIITIRYVDKVISQHNEEQWLYTDELIKKRIKSNIDGILTLITFTFNGLEEIINTYSLTERVRSPQIVIDFIPVYAFKVGNDENLWKRVYDLRFEQLQEFAKGVQRHQTELVNILDIFSKRISPAQMEFLISLQDQLRKIERSLSSSVAWNIGGSQFNEMKKVVSKNLAEAINQCLAEIKKSQNELSLNSIE